MCEWTRNEPMGCLIKPIVVPKKCLSMWDRESPTCVSDVMCGKCPPNVNLSFFSSRVCVFIILNEN